MTTVHKKRLYTKKGSTLPTDLVLIYNHIYRADNYLKFAHDVCTCIAISSSQPKNGRCDNVENNFPTFGKYLTYPNLSLRIPLTKSRQWRSVTLQLSCQHWYTVHLERTQSKPVKFGTFRIATLPKNTWKKKTLCWMKQKVEQRGYILSRCNKHWILHVMWYSVSEKYEVWDYA